MVQKWILSIGVLLISNRTTPTAPQFATFQLLAWDNGVYLYQRNSESGTTEFVQLVDLSVGAKLHFLTAPLDPSLEQSGKPSSPVFQRRTIDYFWQRFRQSYTGAFSVQSGVFYGLYNRHNAQLSFPLKYQNKYLSYGCCNTDPCSKKALVLYLKHAAIRAYHNQDNHPLPITHSLSKSARHIIVGVAPNCNKDGLGRNKHPRTYLGIEDADGDKRYETVVIYTGAPVTEQQAQQTLATFGVQDALLLGGSTQLIYRDSSLFPWRDIVPQAIGVQAAPLFAGFSF